ncbi:putative MFS family transporter protein [Hartmannibacter diazotrophicus]|uniref:Putative MFS family transporter protein n=1 Tax=Hartmannibacter diazotrophicus TaxID=1482074 RepID=A0A2C9D6P4_9HYPH|nr:MFS transporter [Hartmannibacter diazotrophicus]SON55977.1 putative MFS family transporter protein [Hartmannibacter diazotrophicus]
MQAQSGAVPPLSQFQRNAGLFAAIASITAVGIALSLGIPLLSFDMNDQGISGGGIGLSTAVGAVASIVATPLAAPLARICGAARALAGAILLLAIGFPLFYLFKSELAWLVLRFAFYGALTTVFILSEFWINALAPERHRGLIMGIYASVLSAGFAIGPMILAAVGIEGFLPFAAGSGLMLLALVPVLLAVKASPVLDGQSKAGMLRFVFLVPTATFAALAFGAVESSLFALFPVFGLRAGLDVTLTSGLLSAIAIGNLLMQIPIGLISDRVDRRLMLAVIGLASAVLIALVPMAVGWGLVLLYGIVVVFGGLSGGLYTVGLTHLGARHSGGDLALANAAFIFMYGVGMLGGPALSGFALDAFDPYGMPLTLAVILAIYGVFAFLRLRHADKAAVPGSRT